mmetsp:Transcript_20872/g.21653  ORF Transcript_20872/g.21653 Transcript_20872/m.21653 type:complete len:143 (-) Transcript_20872:67-495(-)
MVEQEEKTPLKEYTLEEIKVNDGEDDKPLWIIINGEVLDVTKFAKSHPGGAEALYDEHGEDRFDEFDSIHSKSAKNDAKKYVIGKVKKDIKDNSNGKENIKTKETSSGLAVLMPVLILILSYIFIFKYNILGFFDKPPKFEN